jgi:hypothetical protein
MEKVDRIIQVIREMMVANSPGTGGAYTSKGDPTTVGGFDPLLKFKNKKENGNIDFRRVPQNYKSWVKSIKNK